MQSVIQAKDNNTLHKIMNDVYIKMRNLYGDYLEKVILYGSYARGDYDNESDIDVMVLVKCDDKKIKEMRDGHISCMSDLCLEYEIYIAILVYNIDFFTEWKDYMPLFKNIVKDGINIYA